VLVGNAPRVVVHEDGTLRYRNWVCVPFVDELKENYITLVI